MKYIIFSMLFSVSSLASDCVEKVSEEVLTETKVISTDVPSHLKGAVIIVRRADGVESAVPAEKFKVVPRKQQFVVTKTERSKTLSCSTSKKNRVSLLGGHGNQGGLTTTQAGSTVEVESDTGVVGGAQYQRMLNDTLSIGAQVQTNKTGSVLLGVDF
jgi:hypothetical protein